MNTPIKQKTAEEFLDFVTSLKPDEVMDFLNANGLIDGHLASQAMAPLSAAILQDKRLMAFMTKSTLSTIFSGLGGATTTFMAGFAMGILLHIYETKKRQA